MGYYIGDIVKLRNKFFEASEKSEFSDAIKYGSEIVKLYRDNNDRESLESIYCMGEGLENKLKKEIVKAGSWDELTKAVTSRRYTESAVRRLLKYVLVGLKENTPEFCKYARVLAAGEKGRELIRQLKKDDSYDIPVITNVNKDAAKFPDVKRTLHYDFIASDMYNLINGRGLYDFSDKVVRPYIKIE